MTSAAQQYDLSEIIELRHELSRFPEVSLEERETAERISNYLKEHHPTQIITGLGGHGVAAIYDFGGEGESIMLRCELDALPIHDENAFQHSSTISEVSHKCGHDGHMAILCGVAKLLHIKPYKRGKVILLFQPAEEIGAGARAVLEDERFESMRPDRAVALHNLPGFATGTVILRKETFNAAVLSVIIRLEGVTSHAAQPELGINPAGAISELISEFKKMESRDEGPDFRLLTPVQILMGEEAFGVSAGYGEMKYTLRTWTSAGLNKLCGEVTSIASEIADKYDLVINIDRVQHFAPCWNDPAVADVVERAANLVGCDIIKPEEPFKFGEDFGLFTKSIPGVMFAVGAGENTPPLHSPTYDFPDELIPIGIHLMVSVLDEYLKK